MDRKEFLAQLGTGAASFTVPGCLGGCSKSSEAQTSGTAGPSGVDFTLDLSQTANAALKNNGGYLHKDGVIVARTMAGAYIAVQQSCTHESNSVVYQANGLRFYCDRHGALFLESGAVTSGPAPGALTQYSTSLDGNVLRMYSNQ